jgi:anaerobic magnesium-protoporphyrin IX monomethyl ester cyclase
MKILLVSPPSVPFYMKKVIAEPVLPIGLCYLCAALEKEGHDVIVRDYTGWTTFAMRKDMIKINPQIVGISCFTILRINSYNFAEFAKKILPNCKIIFGGPHASFFPEHVFELTKADFVICGEGEETMVELVNALESHAPKERYTHILGLIYKDPSHKIHKNPPRPMIKNLDEIPFPNYDDFDLSKQTAMPMISSRGCPFACTFCSTNSFWGRLYRARTPKNVVDELEANLKRFNTNKVIFWDDNFTLDKKRAIEICDEIINRELKITFCADARADGVNEALAKKLKDAGCEQLIFGIESGSPIILKNINKGYSLELAKKQLKIAKKYVAISPLIMVGNKGENNETIDETVAFIKETFPEHKPLPYSPVYIFPNSPLYDEVKKVGLITDDYWKKSGIPVFTWEHSQWSLFLLRDRLATAFINRRSWSYLIFIRNNLIRNVFKFMLG